MTAFIAPRPPLDPAAILISHTPEPERAPVLAGVEGWKLASRVEAIRRESGVRAADEDAALRGRQTQRDDDASSCYDDATARSKISLATSSKISLNGGHDSVTSISGHLSYIGCVQDTE